jgi:hypothetical protein
VLELREVEKPAIEDDRVLVLVRVHASSVNPVEWYGVTGPYFARFASGLRRPKDISGLKRDRLGAQPVRNDRLAPAIHFLSTGTDVKPA